MARWFWFAFLAVLLITAAPTRADTVELTSDKTKVAEGGNVGFTVTVTPGTYVTRVTLTYEGETGEDEDTVAPYQFTHTFNTPMNNLTVTATAEYGNGDPDDTDTLDIDVIGISLYGNTNPTRAWPTSYVARSNPAGKEIDQFNWSFVPNGGTEKTFVDYDADDNDVSVWAGRMVIGGSLSVSATIEGVDCSKQKPITINPRAGSMWTMPLSCATDNEPGWGNPVTTTGGFAFGQNRDEASDEPDRIMIPQETDGDFSDAYTLTKVTSGPCEGYWYVSSTVLEIDRETVINKYIKSGGAPPEEGADNWFDHNDQHCVDAAAFVQAVNNHEYRGTPPAEKSEEGHQGRIEKGVDIYGDPRANMESMVGTNKTILEADVEVMIENTEDDISGFADDGPWAWTDGPNWGGEGSLGSGPHARYGLQSHSYSPCLYGPLRF